MAVNRRITFGTDIRRAISGADLYVRLYQIMSLLPVLYILVAAGHPKILTGRNVLTWLFDCGINAIPRAESLLLSWVYRQTASEIIVCFALLLAALAVGILGNRLFRDNHKTGHQTRLVFAVLIAADLLIRLLPFSWNAAFGLPASVFGFAVRIACLILIILDLRAERKPTEIK